MTARGTFKQCERADYGWLKARYTFSFGHYFDPDLPDYSSLRVVNENTRASPAVPRPVVSQYGNSTFIRDEANITLIAHSPLRALLVDLPV